MGKKEKVEEVEEVEEVEDPNAELRARKERELKEALAAER